MSAESLLLAALRGLDPKPPENAGQAAKKRYSEKLSEAVAQAIAAELRQRGLKETRPAPPGEVGGTGAERRLPGGIGAKKVDVTWSTEISGLLLAASIKTINFRDRTTNNFQKNLTNRRGDMLFESVTLHRRFPYAVLLGLFFFDKDAAADGSAKRNSTFQNAHQRFRLFTGRDDPTGRDEQYEFLYIALHDANPFEPSVHFFLAGNLQDEVSLSGIVDQALQAVAVRNPDSYEYIDGRLRQVR